MACPDVYQCNNCNISHPQISLPRRTNVSSSYEKSLLDKEKSPKQTMKNCECESNECYTNINTKYRSSVEGYDDHLSLSRVPSESSYSTSSASSVSVRPPLSSQPLCSKTSTNAKYIFSPHDIHFALESMFSFLLRSFSFSSITSFHNQSSNSIRQTTSQFKPSLSIGLCSSSCTTPKMLSNVQKPFFRTCSPLRHSFISLLRFVMFIFCLSILCLPVISTQSYLERDAYQQRQHQRSDYVSPSTTPFAPLQSDLYFEYYPPHRSEDAPSSSPSSSSSSSSRRGKSRQFGKAPSIGFDDSDLTNGPESFSGPYRTLDPQRFFGGKISGVQVLGKGSQLGGNDYVIRTDIYVPKNARLEIRPGVRVAFAAGVGIIVQGTFVANGTETEKILLTTNAQNSDWRSTISPSPAVPRSIWASIRLVDSGVGNHEGRLQLNYKGRWHSVCTGSRNWTQADVQVVCRQLGFSDGQWYRWFTRHNDSRQFMYENPECSGKEMSIQECSNWNRRQIGSGVCNFHHDIGIRCSPYASQPDAKYWRGVTFIHAESRISTILSNKMEIATSRSVLENVIIENAGRSTDGQYVSGLLVNGGVPPYMSNLTVKNSASTGLNITDPSNGFFLTNSNFISNGAYGVHINSSVGRILMSGINVQNNGADGVHFIHHDKQVFSTDSFCQTPNLGQSQAFPIRYTHHQVATKAPTDECCQDFYANDWKGQRITVHFPVLMSGVESPDPYRTMSKLVVPETTAQIGRDGSIYVIDGHGGKVIADFIVRNGTRVQSVSSILANGPMKVCYRPAHYRNVIFTIEAVVDYGREFDLAIVDGAITNNNGRGVWVENLRSGVIVNETFLSGHDHIAAIHVAGGIGEVVVNNSIITNNAVDGLNVTTGGGYLHVDQTQLLNNTHRAISVWFNESLALRSFNYSSYVTRSIIESNRVGLQIEVGCRFHTPMKQSVFWNISMNTFAHQTEQAINFRSCVPRPRLLKMASLPAIANVSISHNKFTDNQLQALHVAPIFFAKLNIMHNEFERHSTAVLFINNRDSFDVESFVEEAERFPFSSVSPSADPRELTSKRHYSLDSWPVVVRIRNNHFHHNRGHYVASIGLFEPETSRPQNVSSMPQKILFTRNILTENSVSEPFVGLNSRSKTAAVLCVTSSNVLIWRNEFVNRDSKYELAVHLPAHYRMINASLNYWGTWRSNYQTQQLPSQFAPSYKVDDSSLHSAAAICERIFDHKNRYNLAHVEIFPYIMIPNALESSREALSAHIDDRDKISQFFTSLSSGEIGGQVRGQVNLPPGKYYVKRDIYVTPEGELVLNAGTELHFEQSVGIFVQGKFKAKGYTKQDIKFVLSNINNNHILRLKRDTEIVLLNENHTETRFVERSEKVDLKSSLIGGENGRKNATPAHQTPLGQTSQPQQQTQRKIQASMQQSNIVNTVSVRLSNLTEGRLEVRVANEWGTVCGYNFDIEDAAVACHQLGLVLNPRDWRLEKSQFWNAGNSKSILLSNVACTHLDTDLALCKAERLTNGDFESEAWCPMGEVGIRCYPTAWAGIRFGMLTQEAILETVTVERAGLFDYRTHKFVPAVQFDFNRFTVINSIIRSNIDSGLGLLWNDVLSEPYIEGLQVIGTRIAANLNHGIVTKSQGIQIRECQIVENRGAGISYEPTFTRDEQEELSSWVVRRTFSGNTFAMENQQQQQQQPQQFHTSYGRRTQIFTIPNSDSRFNLHYNQSITLDNVGKQTFVYIPRRPTASKSSYRVLVSTSVGHRIGVMAISPVFLTRSTESLKLYAPQLEGSFVPKMIWDMRQNLTAFPFVYSGYRLVLEYSTGQLPYGGVLLLFTAKQYPKEVSFQQVSIAEMSELEQKAMNTMKIVKNEVLDNGKGIIAAHCSMNIDFGGNYCKRYANETIYLERNTIARSKGAGVFVSSYAHSSTIPYSLLLEMLGPEGVAQSELARQDQRKHWRAPEFTLTATIVGEINYTLVNNRLMENGDFGSIVLYDHSLYENGDLQRSSLQFGSGLLMSSAVGANLPANTNLFHWRVVNCTLENNRNGGVDLRLPYTWLYNENFTHTVVVKNSKFVQNRNFEFSIGGHYAKLNLTNNRFVENECKRGVVSVSGMEKAMRIERNEMLENRVQQYVLELNVASHADKFGTVKALVKGNVVRNNRYSSPLFRESNFEASTSSNSGYSPETYAIAIRGVQQVNVTRNILVNRNLQFELLSGVRSGSLQNELDARENWWGVSADPAAIRERIFDFDDWNSFATAHFSPWLSTDRVDAPVYYDPRPTSSNLDRLNSVSSYYLGGRLTHSMTLDSRTRPYIVNADLTIMPGATLTLRPGVIMEFYPSVGILVLGDLVSIGLSDNPVILRPLTRRNSSMTIRGRGSSEESFVYRLTPPVNRKRRQHLPTTEQLVFSKSDIGGVRLCLTENCDPEAERDADMKMAQIMQSLGDDSYAGLKNRSRASHGFLEIYNTTTLQWAPVCDTRFTLRNAQVVCRQLGKSPLNSFVRRGPRHDMDPTLMSRIAHWPEALECVGGERSLTDCEQRTYASDGSDSGRSAAASYQSQPFVRSAESIVRARTPFGALYDNATLETLFYLHDDWTILNERATMQNTVCRYDGADFVYIFCGQDAGASDNDSELPLEYWGGVRFALPAYEESGRSRTGHAASFADPSERSMRKVASSRMQFTNVIGAGVLHGEKSAAVQMVQRAVPLEFVRVSSSAATGVEAIAPPESLNFAQMQIENNLGPGLNMLILGASSSESSRVSFQPLTNGPDTSLPYNAFSLVDICDAKKELRIDEKVIVYYKYDNRPVDCVKIFTSSNPLKRIGVRFLQVNLWSAFAKPEGRAENDGGSGDEFDDDYLQGRKFLSEAEDLFHNRIHSLHENNGNFKISPGRILDDSLLNSMSDSVLLWDGDIFNETTRRLLGEIYSDSVRDLFASADVVAQERANINGVPYSRGYRKRNIAYGGSGSSGSEDSKTRLFRSASYSLSLQLHASGASGRYGFIAEITTLPGAYYADRASDGIVQHNITHSKIRDNAGGAILYRSVGESIAPLLLANNVFERNCIQAWGNFSSCESFSLDLTVQNAISLQFQNNLVNENRAGGLRIRATSFTAVGALKAQLSNNLFAANLHREALYFEGAQIGYSYQTLDARRNYFTRNRSPHRSNIVFGRAVVRFEENVVVNNVADSQLFIVGFAHAQSSSALQHCTRNFFYNNRAVNERAEQSTIIAATVGQVYSDNYLVNPDNNFELATRNRTIVTTGARNPDDFGLRQSLLQPKAIASVLTSAVVRAPSNWWGFNETSAVEARIRDAADYHHLIPVNFAPFHLANWTVLSGSCFGGYEKIGDTCFVYVGGRMNFHSARRFCERDNSSMPFVRAGNREELTRYVYMQQPSFDRRRHPVWVQSFDVPIGTCSVLIDGQVQEHRCDDELPLLCERDPEIGIAGANTLDFWYEEPLGLAAIGISLVTLMMSAGCICCWICKSRHRHLEKLERRNSIRASIRSSRSMMSMNTINSDANYFTSAHRKLLNSNPPTVQGSMGNVSGASLNVGSIYRASGRQAAGINHNPNGHSGRAKNGFFNSVQSISSASSIFDSPLEAVGRRSMRQPNASTSDHPSSFRHQRHQDSDLNMLMRPTPTFDLMYENQGFKGQSTPLSPASFVSSREARTLAAGEGHRAWTPDTNSTLDFKVPPGASSIDARELSQYTASTDNIHKSIPSSASSDSSQSTAPSILSQHSQQPHQHLANIRPSKSKQSIYRNPVQPPLPPPPISISAESHRKNLDATYLLGQQTRGANQAPLYMDNQSITSEQTALTDRSEMMTFNPRKVPVSSSAAPPPIARRLNESASTHRPLGGSQPALSQTPDPYRGPHGETMDSQSQYLETSLDGESFYNESFHHGDERFSPIQSGGRDSARARLYASQPLETAM